MTAAEENPRSQTNDPTEVRKAESYDVATRENQSRSRRVITTLQEDQGVGSKDSFQAMRFSPLTDSSKETGERSKEDEVRTTVDRWVRQIIAASTVEEEQQLKQELLADNAASEIPKTVVLAALMKMKRLVKRKLVELKKVLERGRGMKHCTDDPEKPTRCAVPRRWRLKENQEKTLNVVKTEEVICPAGDDGMTLEEPSLRVQDIATFIYVGVEEDFVIID